ncbi:TonB-dependent receptor domain-containing protein [Rhodoflexus caldus]|uniref:TonB-dependent receptor domain-containing protein n=1 Tax=Rhodoflexus caldus TaxID=2891236 RepID=UPI00202A8E2F|nr:TonB-dependent receptor [Rhodoflexus caldus]
MKHLFLILSFLAMQTAFAQNKTTLSGNLKDKATKDPLPFVNVVLKNAKDSVFVTGTVSNENGLFSLKDLKQGEYVLEVSYIGYNTFQKAVFVGKLNDYLDIGTIELAESTETLQEIVVEGKRDAVLETLDKKTFKMDENLSQGGGSVLQAMKNLPSLTVSQDGKVALRGSDKVTVLIDGKQTALTGFGNQAGLDNIPASAIERIEVINNPSAKNDANGSAGIINIIFKKNQQEGLNGKVGLISGVGALWQKQANLPTIRPQYQDNYKLNPSLTLNYRKKKVNLFFQGDLVSQKVLNKNEFFQRIYDDGSVIEQQFLENRTQTIATVKTGLDWNIDDNNTFTFSALYNRESHIDLGDLPYFNQNLTERKRLWQYHEKEINTALNTSLIYEHKFKQAGHKLTTNFNYTFHRENEKFSFDNYLPTSQSNDATHLIADENVSDLNIDYIKPLKSGRMELGSKLRWRYIPTNMIFIPGQNSVLDLGAQGWANYNEYIGALYGNYVYESKFWEVEAGLRMESIKVNYEVTPTHNTYKSNGYNYLQPFPNLRIAYLVNDNSRISMFYNRRVDRPDEQDLRIFPKYDDPEILKTGNPNLRPQFTQTVELGYKNSWKSGYIYAAAYMRFIDNILTRIVTAPTGSTFINSISQNAGTGRNEGIELVLNQEITKWFSVNVNLNGYQNTISAFSIDNVYPFNVSFQAEQQQIYSGNMKINSIFKLPQNWDIQVSSIYLAPDIIPQGRIESRYSLDLGLKKAIQNGKGELFANASDILNTMRIQKVVTSTGFTLKSRDLYETQIIRVGYARKF